MCRTCLLYTSRCVSETGIGLISFWGSPVQVNPVGDLLSLGAAVMWGCYSVLTRKISGFGYTTVQTTRQVFAYGLSLIHI